MCQDDLYALKHGCLGHRHLPDGRVIALWTMLFGNTRLTVTEPDDVAHFFSQFYCFHDTEAALKAVDTWNGEGDPDGWVRHVPSNRRRTDGDPATEHVTS